MIKKIFLVILSLFFFGASIYGFQHPAVKVSHSQFHVFYTLDENPVQPYSINIGMFLFAILIFSAAVVPGEENKRIGEVIYNIKKKRKEI